MVFALLLLTSCSTYYIRDVNGITSEAPDNPNVNVTSDVEFIKKIPRASEPQMDLKLTPGLAISFERALEKYVSEGEYRIISAELAVATMLNNQHATLTMLVEANGRTIQTRHDWDTSSAGFTGSKPYNLVPEYLDASAKQLSENLQ